MLREEHERPIEVLDSRRWWRIVRVSQRGEDLDERRDEPRGHKDNVDGESSGRRELVRIGVGTVVPAVSRSVVGCPLRRADSDGDDDDDEGPWRPVDEEGSGTIARARVEGASRAELGRRHERHQCR